MSRLSGVKLFFNSYPFVAFNDENCYDEFIGAGLKSPVYL